MALRFEVWTRPSAGTFARKFPIKVPTQFNLALGMFGHGLIVVPSDYARLDDILFVDPTNHANDESSLIRAFSGSDWLFDFYAARMVVDVNETGTRVATITGGGLGTSLDRVVVFPYDHDVNPSIQPRWAYGSGNSLLTNGDFEEDVGGFPNGGDFEDDNVEPWKALSGTDTHELDADLQTTTDQAQGGTKSLEVDPGKFHSGPVIDLDAYPGEELIIDGFVLGFGVRRITAAVKVEDGMTFASTNGYVFNGWHIVEIGNVLKSGTGLPGGATDGTWQALGTIKVTPGPDTTKVKYVVQDDHHNGTNGPIFYVDTFSLSGFGVGMAPWGSYLLTAMDLDDTGHVISGAQSGKVTGPAEAALWQDISGMVIGTTYTYSATVYHEAGVNKDMKLQFVVNGSPGKGVAGATVSVPTHTETILTVTWIATTEIGRLETKNKSGGVLTWWVDDQKAGEGLPADTFGKIFNDFVDDSAIDHAPRAALDWVTRTWTDALDSNAVAWDQDVSYSINRGQKYRRIIEFHGNEFGYEADMHPAVGDLTDIELDLFNPDGLGDDDTATDAGAITGAGVISVGPLIRREPRATRGLVEGGDQYFAVGTDAPLQGAWGDIESYEGSDELQSSILSNRASLVVDGTDAETIVVKSVNPPQIPGVAYRIGDIKRLILGKYTGRFTVTAIDVTSGNPEPEFQVQFTPEA